VALWLQRSPSLRAGFRHWTLLSFTLALRPAAPEPLFTDCFLHIAAVVLLLRWRFSMVMKRDETDLEVSYGLHDAQFGRVISSCSCT
jgi:hypothetical protein